MSPFQATPMTAGGRQPHWDWQVTESLGVKEVILVHQRQVVPALSMFQGLNRMYFSQAHSKCFRPKLGDIKLEEQGRNACS